MKNKITLILLLCIFSICVHAQHITVSGTVTDTQDNPLIGASVLVVGTTNGVITDLDGKYTIKAQSGQSLKFSYVGYQEKIVKLIKDRKTLDVKLTEGERLDEVVVTALGIKKEKKALSYSITEVKGEDMNRVKVANVATGLAGKVAGVNVSKPASGVMGSSRIIIRGNGSLNGDNQPLYVVDGVPINNSNYGQAGQWGGSDGGDGISSINSEDIESISVLKGGTAAALYGSRASNGAIVITTKKGASGKVSIDYNLSYTNDHIVFKNDDLQWEYGLGAYGMNPEVMAKAQCQQAGYPESYIPMIAKQMAIQMGMLSFGGKLDGSDVMQFDGERRPYTSKTSIKTLGL